MRAVVFAYHDIGVRSLQVLHARGIEIALVITHHDQPHENIWFESVANWCAEMAIPYIAPADANAPELLTQIAALQPDFIFSFYYRQMLPMNLLACARHGAFNLHGSLLPRYRGRVPVNWAVLHGETETGVTLHWMVEKPDAGAIVDQVAVPILPDDTAHDVFKKLTVAAEQTLWRALPLMLAGQTPRLSNDLSQGSYFGGRTPEDGRINWSQPAQVVYNLVRAVAPPYPGAFTLIADKRLVIAKARLAYKSFSSATGLNVIDGQMVGICGDGAALLVLELRDGEHLLTADQLRCLL